jgi:hypothetical protein
VRALGRLAQHSGQTIIKPHNVTRALVQPEGFPLVLLYPLKTAAEDGLG